MQDSTVSLTQVSGSYNAGPASVAGGNAPSSTPHPVGGRLLRRDSILVTGSGALSVAQVIHRQGIANRGGNGVYLVACVRRGRS